MKPYTHVISHPIVPSVCSPAYVSVPDGHLVAAVAWLSLNVVFLRMRFGINEKC